MTGHEIFHLLRSDHDLIANLFEDLDDAADTATSEAVRATYLRLRNELKMHAKAEQETIYPALTRHREAKESVHEALEEHEDLQYLLDELDTLPVDDEDWGATLIDLKEAVEHHVHYEEMEIFRLLQGSIGQEERDRLADAFTRAKEDAAKALRFSA
jgi:iron-sulfur cluster repair protein YtfE (RIC family)